MLLLANSVAILNLHTRFAHLETDAPFLAALGTEAGLRRHCLYSLVTSPLLFLSRSVAASFETSEFIRDEFTI
jgi:hypothetical protein